MAYRFLLEVPRALTAEANVAVAEAGDAEVILVRDSHGLGFDDPYADMTVAAHSLNVIDSLYDWFDTLGASRPDIRIVLHDGDRLPLEAVERGAMVAAIRRDQPWVERSIPKIGEHVTEDFAPNYTEGVTADEERLAAAGPSEPAAGSGNYSSWLAPGADVAQPDREVTLRSLSHIAVRVLDLARAEQFYSEFFGMELLGRARRSERGGFVPIDGDYRWAEAYRKGTEADVSFMRNGPLGLALYRAGRGARLDRYGVLDHLSVFVDATTFAKLKGEVLMRSLETLATGETAFRFRDPFGLVWELAIQGTPAAAIEE